MSKVNVKVLSNPEPVRIEYNGVTFKEAGRRAEAGDIIRINSGHADVTRGGYYLVERIRHDGDPEFIDDDGDRRDSGYMQYVVFRKEPAKPVEYREVKRKARVGDRIKIVEPYACGGQYRKGDILTVCEPRIFGLNRVVFAEGVEVGILETEYVVLEPIPTFEKGEKVRLISGGGDYPLYGFEDGEIYEVNNPEYTDHDIANPAVSISTDSGIDGYAKPEQLEKVTEKPKLSVGDYVKFIEKYIEHREGKVAVIREVDDSVSEDTFKYGLNDLSGKHSGWAKLSVIEKITKEEAEELHAKAEEGAKWSAIGRKPGEYKEGDIVVVTENRIYTKKGDVSVVRSTDGYGLTLEQINRNGIHTWVATEYVDIVTPVEQRFDRK